MRSPSATKAMGPPSTASGATWPTQNPWVPPEKRPSVTSAQSPPRPTPFMAPVMASISHAGTTLGSFVADDHDRVGHDRPRQDGVHRLVLAVEDPRRAVEEERIDAGHLHHR